jgi:hypothetical protein
MVPNASCFVLLHWIGASKAITNNPHRLTHDELNERKPRAMGSDDQRIADEAVVFAKANRKGIARRLTDPSIFLSEDSPVSVFMAGSPGAGKTEASLEFLSRFWRGRPED